MPTILSALSVYCLGSRQWAGIFLKALKSLLSEMCQSSHGERARLKAEGQKRKCSHIRSGCAATSEGNVGFSRQEMATTLKNNLVLLVNLFQELKMTFISSLCLSLFFKREKTIGKNSHILLM